VTFDQALFLPTLFRAKPELGAAPELWLAAGERRRDLLEALISHGILSPDLINKIIGAILDSDSEFLLRRGLDAWAKPAVFGVMDWISKTKRSLSDRSLWNLTHYVESIAAWAVSDEKHSLHSIIFAAHIIAPYTYQFKRLDSTIWLRAYRELVSLGNSMEASYFATLLVALGFQNAPPNALALVEECYDKVHQLEWDDALPDETWLILDPLVPHLWWLHDWDKSERLRRGLVEAFVRNQWPLLKLSDCVKSDVFLKRVVDSAHYVNGGREFISQPI
jgi:hypothetical protein